MIVPSSNTALEPEVGRLVAGRSDLSVHFSRVRVTEVSLEPAAAAQFDAEPMLSAASLLVDARLDAVAWAGTAGSWLGTDHDRRLVDLLSEATGVPGTTSTLALLDACAQLGITGIGLITPYADDVVERITSVYAGEGLTVVAEHHLGITDNYAFGQVGPDVMEPMILACGQHGAEAVLIVCTNLRATSLIETMEEQLSLPVLDSIAVTLSKTAALAGIPVLVPEYTVSAMRLPNTGSPG